MSDTQKMSEISHNILSSLNGMNAQDAVLILSTCLAHILEPMPDDSSEKFLDASIKMTNSILEDMRNAPRKETFH